MRANLMPVLATSSSCSVPRIANLISVKLCLINRVSSLTTLYSFIPLFLSTQWALIADVTSRQVQPNLLSFSLLAKNHSSSCSVPRIAKFVGFRETPGVTVGKSLVPENMLGVMRQVMNTEDIVGMGADQKVILDRIMRGRSMHI